MSKKTSPILLVGGAVVAVAIGWAWWAGKFCAMSRPGTSSNGIACYFASKRGTASGTAPMVP